MALTPKEIASQIRYEFGLWDIDGRNKVPNNLIVAYMKEAELEILHSLVDDALVEVLSDRELMDRLTEGVRAIKDGRLSWDTISKRTLEVYEKTILGNTSHGTALCADR